MDHSHKSPVGLLNFMVTMTVVYMFNAWPSIWSEHATTVLKHGVATGHLSLLQMYYIRSRKMKRPLHEI